MSIKEHISRNTCRARYDWEGWILAVKFLDELILFWLAILDISLAVKAGGLRVLMQALLDGQLNMTEVLVHALVYVLDNPHRRCYLRPGVELEMIVAPFTESGKGPNYEERLKNSAKVVTLLLKSWPGVFLMCANNLRAARSVIQALRYPMPETQVCLKILRC